MLILIAVISLASMAILYVLLQKFGTQSQSQKMAIITGNKHAAQASGDNPNARRAMLAKRLKSQGHQDENAPKKNSLSIRLLQAGLSHVSPTKYWVFSAISAVVFVLLGLLLGQNGVMIILFLLIGLLGFPRYVLGFLTKRRQKRFMNDFADALDAMVRLLKAGMPVSEAVSMVAREFNGPVGEEMARMYDEQKIGISMAESAVSAARRMPLAEMQMFATGIAIQQQTGSSLSEIMTNLSKLIRARFRLKRKVIALSSEAKASAMIIGALPIFVSVGLYLINPKYMTVLFITATGKILLGCAIGWMLVGILVMRQMINFKV
ncbi:MAG: type II secretion system F family protein [Pseudomonadota bacterium]